MNEDFISTAPVYRSDFRPEGTPLTEGQRELRKLVYKQIDADPDTFSMSSWESTGTRQDESCRTTRCIAGWAQFFARGYVDRETVAYDAIGLLGLSEAEWRGWSSSWWVWSSSGLFYTSDYLALERMRELAEC